MHRAIVTCAASCFTARAFSATIPGDMESPAAPTPHGWRSWLPRVLAESVLIVFSVLLALAVDQWRDDTKLAREVQEARIAFANEIRGNRDLLASDQFHGHHKRMWAHYRALSDAAKAADQARLAELQKITLSDFSNGVRPTPLRDAVWRSFSQSGIVRDMKPTEVFLLADTYREQDALDRWHHRMFDIWSQPSADIDRPEYQRSQIETTRSYLADVVAAEERLLERCGEVLAQLVRPPTG